MLKCSMTCVHAPDSQLPPKIIPLWFDHPGVYWLLEMPTLQPFSEEVYLVDIGDNYIKLLNIHGYD